MRVRGDLVLWACCVVAMVFGVADGAIIVSDSSLSADPGVNVNVGSSSPLIVDWGLWQGGLSPNGEAPKNRRDLSVMGGVTAIATDVDEATREDTQGPSTSFTYDNGLNNPDSGTVTLGGGLNLNNHQHGWRAVFLDIDLETNKTYKFTQYVTAIGTNFELDAYNNALGTGTAIASTSGSVGSYIFEMTFQVTTDSENLAMVMLSDDPIVAGADRLYVGGYTLAIVPEPSAIALLVTGIAAAALLGLRRAWIAGRRPCS